MSYKIVEYLKHRVSVELLCQITEIGHAKGDQKVVCVFFGAPYFHDLGSFFVSRYKLC